MRNLISFDSNGHIIGEFPHDPLAGFQASRRGLRRRLMNAKEVPQYSPEQALAIAQQRYDAEEKRIRESQFVENENKRQQEYRKKNISLSDAADTWLKHVAVVNSSVTVARYAQTIRLYLSTVGDHRLRDFSRDHNIRFYDELASVKAVNSGDCIHLACSTRLDS